MLCRLAEHWVYIAILPRPITTLTALYIMVAHLARKSKKMIISRDLYFECWVVVGSLLDSELLVVYHRFTKT